MAKNNKKITLESLAAEMRTGFIKVNTNIKESVDELAQITAKGFENVGVDISNLKSDVGQLQSDVSDIKLRLDNLAPKFEVKDLEKRVRRLEEKTGIRHTA